MFGQIEYDIDGRLVCEICGLSFDKLGSHAFMVHHMSAKDYKKKFGLNLGQGLMSERSKNLARIRNSENFELVVTDNLKRKGVSTRFKKGDKGRTRDMISKQCYDQLCKNLHRIRMPYEHFIEIGRNLGNSGKGNIARWAKVHAEAVESRNLSSSATFRKLFKRNRKGNMHIFEGECHVNIWSDDYRAELGEMLSSNSKFMFGGLVLKPVGDGYYFIWGFENLDENVPHKVIFVAEGKNKSSEE